MNKGFPGLDTSTHGLVQVQARERGGLLFVTHKAPISEGALAHLPDLMEAGQGNSHFTFGRHEKAAVHFHQHLAAHLQRLAQR